MSIENFHDELKRITCDFADFKSTRILTAQLLIEWLSRVDEAEKIGEITKSIKNRHFVLLLQHLSLVCRSPGPNFWMNRFKRGNLLFKSQPLLVISGVDFSGLILPEFNLINTILLACKFDEADLRKSRFGGRYGYCQLFGCSFRRADLSYADFRRSSLYGCSFEDANTRNAKGIV